MRNCTTVRRPGKYLCERSQRTETRSSPAMRFATTSKFVGTSPSSSVFTRTDCMGSGVSASGYASVSTRSSVGLLSLAAGGMGESSCEADGGGGETPDEVDAGGAAVDGFSESGAGRVGLT